MQRFLVLDENGNMVAQVFGQNGAPNIQMEPSWRSIALDRFGDLSNERHDGTGWVADMDQIRTRLADAIDSGREARQMDYLTIGGAKKMIYMQKAKEVENFRALGATALAALNLEARRARFPAAMAEADLTGVALATVITKFETGANIANAAVLRVEAIAQRAKATLMKATSPAAAQAAAAIDWSKA